MARGKYLTNTNLDDLRRIDSIELQARALESCHFADVTYQDVFYTLDHTLSFDEISKFNFKTELPLVTAHNLLEMNLPHNAPMWRKSLHDEVGFFDASLTSAADWEFWLRCYLKGKTFWKNNTPHVAYFQNPRGSVGLAGVGCGGRLSRLGDRRGAERQTAPVSARECEGASIVPTKDRIEWPYVVLLVGIVVMVAAALHLLSAWVAFLIFAVLWVGFAIWSKTHR